MANRQNNWRGRLKPWAPPILLDLYRRIRWPAGHEPATSYGQGDLFRLPARPLGALFAGIERMEVAAPVSQAGRRDDWVMPLNELLILAAICKHAQPQRVFEIGTYTGVSTLFMALNAPDEAEVFTLDLDPAARDTHRHGLGVGGFPAFEVGGAYQGTPAAARVRQLYGPSATYDYSAFEHTIDLVLVDADHTYEFVKQDTATAFRLLRPGGIIVWDDYLWDARYPECEGVTRCVNEVAEGRSVFRIDGSRLAIYLDGQ